MPTQEELEFEQGEALAKEYMEFINGSFVADLKADLGSIMTGLTGETPEVIAEVELQIFNQFPAGTSESYAHMITFGAWLARRAALVSR